MPSYTFYATSTGAILGSMVTGTLEEAESNLQAGQGLIEGLFNPATQIIQNGAAVTGQPQPTVAQLLAHANAKQNVVLAQVWSFNVGTSDAPVMATTRLDRNGRADMTTLATWLSLNASNPSATEAYSNVDYSAVTLTYAQAQSLVTQAGAIFSTSIATLNEVAAGIMAATPTITTKAQIDAAAWPSPA